MADLEQKHFPVESKGLFEPLDNADKLSKVKCPNCEKIVEFYPDDLYWDSDENFEFCDVTCTACNVDFELCAGAGDNNYDFFAN